MERSIGEGAASLPARAPEDGISPFVVLAVDEVIRAAITLGASQAYSDIDPNRQRWVNEDQRWLDRTKVRLWRALREERDGGI